MKKQKDVVSILYALDRKIELNKQIMIIYEQAERRAKRSLNYAEAQP